MRALIAVAALIVLIAGLFASGVRFTTASAKRDAETSRAETTQLRYDNAQLRKELRDLKIRHEEVLDRLEESIIENGEDPAASPDIIRVPGFSEDDDDDDSDETRIIERNSSTVSPPQNKDDGDDNPPLVEAPELPELPDVGKTKDDLLKNTPLEGML